MIDAAEVTYLVADSTKIGKTAFASLGALSLIDISLQIQKLEEDKKLFGIIKLNLSSPEFSWYSGVITNCGIYLSYADPVIEMSYIKFHF
jgi:hypothetical protein